MLGSNGDILIGDDVVHLCAVAYNSTLSEDAVLDLCALADFYTSEQHTVLNFALDYAAVCNKRVLDDTVEIVLSRCVVAYLGIDGSLGNEELSCVLGMRISIFALKYVSVELSLLK